MALLPKDLSESTIYYADTNRKKAIADLNDGKSLFVVVGDKADLQKVTLIYKSNPASKDITVEIPLTIVDGKYTFRLGLEKVTANSIDEINTKIKEFHVQAQAKKPATTPIRQQLSTQQTEPKTGQQTVNENPKETIVDTYHSETDELVASLNTQQTVSTAQQTPHPDASLTTREFLTKYKENPFKTSGINPQIYSTASQTDQVQMLNQVNFQNKNPENPQVTIATDWIYNHHANPPELKLMINDALLKSAIPPQQSQTHQVQADLQHLSATFTNDTPPANPLLTPQKNVTTPDTHSPKSNHFVTKDKTRQDFDMTCNLVGKHLKETTNSQPTVSGSADMKIFLTENNEKIKITFDEPKKQIEYEVAQFPNMKIGAAACLKAMKEQGETEVLIKSTDLYGAGYTAIEAKRLGLEPIFDKETVAFIKKGGYTDTEDFLKRIQKELDPTPDAPHTTFSRPNKLN